MEICLNGFNESILSSFINKRKKTIEKLDKCICSAKELALYQLLTKVEHFLRK
jgi:hypothetical protein